MICEQCAWWTMKRWYSTTTKGTGSVTVCEDVGMCIHPDKPRGQRDGWIPQCENFERVERCRRLRDP